MTQPEIPNATADTTATELTAKGRAVRKQAEAMERRKKALELRKSGLTYQQIADAVGYRNKSSAHDAVASGLRDITHEAASDLRALELERLDEMLKGLWPQVQAGDPQAVSAALRVMERRAKLLGLDAPEKLMAAVHQSGEGALLVERYEDMTEAELDVLLVQWLGTLQRVAPELLSQAGLTSICHGDNGKGGATPCNP